MAANVFKSKDYKDFLRAKIREAKSSWGLIRQLSEAAGCQRSYLSQVVNGHAQLTKDQAFGLTQYWQLDQAETEAFLTLVEISRSSSPRYRARLEQKLTELRLDNENLSRKVGPARVMNGEAINAYYSSWHWAAIHILCSIGKYQTVKAIAERLQLPQMTVSQSLEELRQLGLVQKEDDRWVFQGGSIHLPKTSPMAAVLHQNWRSRAVWDVQLRRESSIHYSSLHSLSFEAYDEIKGLLLRAIERSHEIAGPSKSEELACVNIDLFSV